MLHKVEFIVVVQLVLYLVHWYTRYRPVLVKEPKEHEEQRKDCTQPLDDLTALFLS